VQARVSFGNKSQEFDCYVLSRSGSHLVDWYATTGYNRIPLRVYRATIPNTPNTFRLKGQLDDYYNFEYSDKKLVMYSIRLSDTDNTGIQGYAHKESDDGKAILDLMKDGSSIRSLWNWSIGRQF